MSIPKSLIGKKFDKLTVVKVSDQRVGGAFSWECRCDCGNVVVRRSRYLKIISSQSCDSCKTPNRSGTPEHNSWRGMRNRCYHKTHNRFYLYGGRGIVVCERWKNSFENFLEDMGKRPNGTSLDRIDFDGDYTPENCRWASIKEQNDNKRTQQLLTYNNETKSIRQWEVHLGLNRATLWARLNLGWTVERALSTPVRKKKTGS